MYVNTINKVTIHTIQEYAQAAQQKWFDQVIDNVEKNSEVTR